MINLGKRADFKMAARRRGSRLEFGYLADIDNGSRYPRGGSCGGGGGGGYARMMYEK